MSLKQKKKTMIAIVYEPLSSKMYYHVQAAYFVVVFVYHLLADDVSLNNYRTVWTDQLLFLLPPNYVVFVHNIVQEIDPNTFVWNV